MALAYEATAMMRRSVSQSDPLNITRMGRPGGVEAWVLELMRKGQGVLHMFPTATLEMMV